MIDKTDVIEKFKKCSEPMDYVSNYMYVKPKDCDETDVISILEQVEKLNLLAALYIVILKESALADRYIRAFFDRNEATLVENVKEPIVDSADIVSYIQVVYICLMHLSEDKRKVFCNKTFSGDTYKRHNGVELRLVESEKKVSEHYAWMLVAAISEFFPNNIGWEKAYCQIVTDIYEARRKPTKENGWAEYFLRGVEINLHKKKYNALEKKPALEIYLREGIVNSELGIAREYFDLLCATESFKEAGFFLSNFADKKNKTILGLSPEEFAKEALYPLPATNLLAIGKWYCNGRRSEDEESIYSYEDWLADIEKSNKDENILRWIRLTIFFNRLLDTKVKGDSAGFWKIINTASDFEMFDMSRINYSKQIFEKFAYIFNTMIVDEDKTSSRKVLDLLRQIDHINVNSYKRISRDTYLGNRINGVTKSYEYELGKREEYDYTIIENALFSNFNYDEIIYIYMNSHLKSCIAIDHFVERCNEKASEDKIDRPFDIFEQYPLEGRVAVGEAFRGISQKIIISPTVVLGANYSGYRDIQNKNRNNPDIVTGYFRRLIKNDEEWYSHNKEVGELINDVRDYCKFIISGYSDENGILAKDIELLYDDVKQDRIEDRETNFPTVVDDWLREIRESKQCIDWDRREKIYEVFNFSDWKVRRKIALDILETAVALKDEPEELAAFMNRITHPPLYNLNECRYRIELKYMNLVFSESQEKEVKDKEEKEIVEWIAKQAETILNCRSLSSAQKKEVCMNTCIVKYYDFYKICEAIGDEFFIDKSDKPFYFWLTCVEKSDDYAIFKTEATQRKKGDNEIWKFRNTLYTDDSCEFRYYGRLGNAVKPDPNRRQKCVLKGFDDNHYGFLLDEVLQQEKSLNDWEKFLRRLRDAKKLGSNGYDRIKTDLEGYRVGYYNEFKVADLIHLLNTLFIAKGLKIKDALDVIGLLPAYNPFIRYKRKYYKRVLEVFSENYQDDNCLETYEELLKDYRENNGSKVMFYDLYLKSFLKLFITEDEFFRDISVDEREREKIKKFLNQ